MNFGTTYTGNETKPCAICRAPVTQAEKVVVERETLHNKCFKCSYCDAALKHGSCAMFKTPVGLRWFCSGRETKACALLDTSERYKKLKK